MSKTPFVKTTVLPRARSRATTANASVLVTELDAALEAPGVIGAINADVPNLRFHAEGVKQAVVVVGVAIGLVRRKVDSIGPFDEIELVDLEGHHRMPLDLGGLEVLH